MPGPPGFFYLALPPAFFCLPVAGSSVKSRLIAGIRSRATEFWPVAFRTGVFHENFPGMRAVFRAADNRHHESDRRRGRNH